MQSNRMHALVMASIALGLGACSTPATEDGTTEVEEEIIDAATSGSGTSAEQAPEPEFRDFDPTEGATVTLRDGLSIELGSFERTQDAHGQAAAITDVTITNDTGATFDPQAINLSVAQGAEGRDADAAVMELNEHGAGSSAEFGAPIGDGESVTVAHGFSVDADEERIAVRIQPWDVDQAAEVTLSGNLPA